MAIAVVTGAAGGVGRAINRALGRAGSTIAVVDLEAPRCAAEGISAFVATHRLRLQPPSPSSRSLPGQPADLDPRPSIGHSCARSSGTSGKSWSFATPISHPSPG